MPFPLPEYIQLYPTNRCNQKCSFCFNAEQNGAEDLPYENALRLLDILSKNGIREIDIMGGEPFLLPWIADFIEDSVSKNIKVNISTNGSKPSASKKLKRIGSDKIQIGVSLEGSTEEKHNKLTHSSHFLDAVSTIKELLTSNLNPAVKTVVTRSSMDDVQDIITLIRNIGVTRYYLLHMDFLGKSDALRKETLSYPAFMAFFQKTRVSNSDMDIGCVHASCFRSDVLPSNTRCAGGVRKLAILPDGSAYPCNLLISFDALQIGNIFTEDFSSLWSNSKLAFFRNFKTNRCGIESCTNRPLCTGGCPAHGLYHYNNPDHTDIRCVL